VPPPTAVRVRKPLAALTQNEVKDIADPGVKALAVAKLSGGDPKKVFANEANLPFFDTKDGRRIPIKRVRVNKTLKPFTLGEGRTVRHVASESNHHVEIYAELDKDGNEGKWGGEVVSMFEAFQRLKARKPVVERDHGPLVKFKFSLAPGEALECDDGKGERRLLVVRSFSQFTTGQIQIGLVRVNDARKKADITKDRGFFRPGPDGLREWNARKVVVSPLGDVTEARD
jgi:hypothetical protein